MYSEPRGTDKGGQGQVECIRASEKALDLPRNLHATQPTGPCICMSYESALKDLRLHTRNERGVYPCTMAVLGTSRYISINRPTPPLTQDIHSRATTCMTAVPSHRP